MPKLKALSGDEIVKILSGFGFTIHSQKGSHVKLKRKTPEGNETLVIPLRNPVPVGTLKSIFNQASRFVSQNEIRKHFYDQ